MNSPFLVLLAIGTAALHDTGRRLEMPVIAPNKLEACVIAERNALDTTVDEIGTLIGGRVSA